MKAPSRPLLALLALILASLACLVPPETVTKGQVSCEYAGYGTKGSTYYCTCPLNGVVQDIKASDLNNNSNADVYVAICGPDLGNQLIQSELDQAAATEPPTEEPTEAPQEKAPPTDAPTDSAPLEPFLTGTFTACDNTAGYVNFSIAENAPAYDPATFKMLFNGQEAKCTPAASNSKTLTCNYPPAPYGPPAYIQVYVGEEKVNDFKFPGGSICNVPSQPNNSDDNQEQEPSSTEPAPTDESSD